MGQFSTKDSYSPFSSKEIGSQSLFTRVHGSSFEAVIGLNTHNFNIPYPNVKFNEMEIIGCEVGDSIDLSILDTPTGLLSTVPNYKLNQFGFSVFLPNGFYQRLSKYDASLIKDMKISVDYESVTAKTVYLNFILHELK